MGSTLNLPEYLGYLANAHTQLGQIDDAWRCIGEAMTIMEASGETWCEAELHRIAGEIALKSPEPDAVKAEAYFERALAVARQQQAKSWELRAAMSMARLWRDQGKRDEARDLLAPVYGWFTEGFDTLDLKEAKALLESWRHEPRERMAGKDRPRSISRHFMRTTSTFLLRHFDADLENIGVSSAVIGCESARRSQSLSQ